MPRAKSIKCRGNVIYIIHPAAFTQGFLQSLICFVLCVCFKQNKHFSDANAMLI